MLINEHYYCEPVREGLVSPFSYCRLDFAIKERIGVFNMTEPKSKELEKTAYHEADHAVMAYSLKQNFAM